MCIRKLQLSAMDSIFNIANIQQVRDAAEKCLTNVSIALTPNLRYIIHNNEKQELLKKFHDDPIFGGHCGERRLLNKLKSKYYWKYMKKDVTKYVQSCTQCQKSKSMTKHKEKLTLTVTPQKAFDIVQIDTIGPFVQSNPINMP